MKKKFDPLSFIPSPEVIRQSLADERQLVRRLEVLLKVSEEIHEKPTDAKEQTETAAPSSNRPARRPRPACD